LFGVLIIFPTFASRFGGRETVRRKREGHLKKTCKKETWQGLFEIRRAQTLRKIKK
jgi:hypothetical protein